MEFFDALNIESIPTDQNSVADKLAVSTSTLQPSEEMLGGYCPLEIKFRPSMPDNVEHWQVFKDDEQILKFINSIDEFSNFKANEQEQGKECQKEGKQFDNPMPRGFVALENIFDRQDRRKNNINQMKPGDYIEVNIGSENEPKMIK